MPVSGCDRREAAKSLGISACVSSTSWLKGPSQGRSAAPDSTIASNGSWPCPERKVDFAIGSANYRPWTYDQSARGSYIGRTVRGNSGLGRLNRLDAAFALIGSSERGAPKVPGFR